MTTFRDHFYRRFTHFNGVTTVTGVTGIDSPIFKCVFAFSSVTGVTSVTGVNSPIFKTVFQLGYPRSKSPL